MPAACRSLSLYVTRYELLEAREVLSANAAAFEAPVAEVGTHAAYVQNLYRDVLERPADAVGAEVWTTALDRGELSRREVAEAFLNSAEYRTAQLDAWYREHLDRELDSLGAAGWLAAFEAGQTPQQVLASILRSDEYHQLAGSGLPDTDVHPELGAAAEEINRDTVIDLIDEMFLAEDYLTTLLDGTEAQPDIGWYDQYLGRNADAYGLQQWLNQLAAGYSWDDVQASLLASDEYFQKPAA